MNHAREIIQPKDRSDWLRLRLSSINSSESPGLLGLSPYCTTLELFHRKKDCIVIEDPAPPEYVRWGNRLERAIAEGVAEDKGWTIRPMKEFMRLPELRMGSSFDFAIGDDGILEVKNVFGIRFKTDWLRHDDGSLEAPPHIEMQVQHQLAVSGRKYAYIAALVSGNEVVLIKREPDADIIGKLQSKIRDFWAMVDCGVPPTPDFARDAEFIARLYQQAQAGKVYHGTGDIMLRAAAERYQEAQAQEKDACVRKQAAKAEMLTIINDAATALGDGFKISASTVPGAHIEYDREPYRTFRLTWSKH